jgi:hypothetical protein
MTGVYTYAGNYAAYFKSLPDDIPELCNLICSQVIHRVIGIIVRKDKAAPMSYKGSYAQYQPKIFWKIMPSGFAADIKKR